MIVVLLSLSSAGMLGSADFLAGRIARDLPPATVAMWINATALVLTVIAWLGFGMPGLNGETALTGSGVGYALAAGVFSAFGIVAFYTALARSPMSLAAPLTATGTVVPAGVAIASGQVLSTSTAIGLLLALTGAVLVSSGTRGGYVRFTREGLLISLLAALLTGLTLTAIQRAVIESPDAAVTVIAIQRLVVVMATASFVTFRSVTTSLREVSSMRLFIAGLLDGGGIALFAIASDVGSDAVAAILFSLFSLVTVLLAGVFLHEKLSARQALGVAAAVAGVALISAT